MSQEGLCHSLTALTATVITAYQKEDIVRYQYVKIPSSLLPFPWHFSSFAANTPLHFKIIIDTSFQSKIYNKLNTLFSLSSINLEEHEFYKSATLLRGEAPVMETTEKLGHICVCRSLRSGSKWNRTFPRFKAELFLFCFNSFFFFVLDVLIPLPFSWLDVNEILKRIHIWGLIHTFSESK